MRAITLYQPYASLVAVGAKTIETRSWGTPYRGPLLIHASRKSDGAIAAACREACARLCHEAYEPATDDRRRAGEWTFEQARGCVVAVARLADCRPMMRAPDTLNHHFGTFGAGRYGWVLAEVVPLLRPVPWRGMQGLWPAPDDLLALVREATPAAVTGGVA